MTKYRLRQHAQPPMLLARRRGARSARRTLSTASVTPVRWGFLVSTCAPTNEQRQYPFQEAGVTRPAAAVPPAVV